MPRLGEGRLDAATHRCLALLGWRFFVAIGLILLPTGCTPEHFDVPDALPPEPWLYLMAFSDARWTLAAADIATGELTPLLEGVYGFAPAQEGFIVALDEGRTLARWDGERLHRLWDCIGLCRDPVLSHDGRNLAWIEEVEGEHEGWTLVFADGAVKSLGILLSRPVWNPTGDQLAAITPEGLVLWSAAGERIASLDLQLFAAQPSWAKTGDRIAVITLAGVAVSLVPQSLMLDSEIAFLQPLAAEEVFAQTSELAWSPTGEQIALLRRRFFPPEESYAGEDGNEFHEESSGADALGPQPWLFALKEGDFTPLPGDGGASFARPVWSPDGRRLAAVRLPMGTPDPRPEVWVWDVVTGQLLQRFPETAAPAWGG